MLGRTPLLLKSNKMGLPIRPLVMPPRVKGSRQHENFNKRFWQYAMRTDRNRSSFWVSDFRHKYLIRTGRYFTGKVPESPPPGYLPNVIDSERYMNRHPAPPTRETRHLPIMPLTPRVVYEHRVEAEEAYFGDKLKFRRIMMEQREVEFHNWYSRLQRVRGRWCREQGVASRGVYGPAVDASEIWG